MKTTPAGLGGGRESLLGDLLTLPHLPDHGDTNCRDCGRETLPNASGAACEWYMVHDEVWAAAGMAPRGGCLCVGCLESRLGRRLVARDFPLERINDLSVADQRWAWSWRTPRLRRRLTTGRRPRSRRGGR
jgi:hypothetical protein